MFQRPRDLSQRRSALNSTRDLPRPQQPLARVHVTWELSGEGRFSGPTLIRFECAGVGGDLVYWTCLLAGSDRCRALDDSKRRVVVMIVVCLLTLLVLAIPFNDK